MGGGGIVHDCGTSRGIGYFLEPLVLIALFAKRPLDITLKGVTNHGLDPSVDVFRSVTIPLMKKIGIEGLELKVSRVNSSFYIFPHSVGYSTCMNVIISLSPVIYVVYTHADREPWRCTPGRW